MSHDDNDNLADRPWNAPWQQGHVPTPVERQEYADLYARVLAKLLELSTTERDRRVVLKMAWHLIFEGEEFRDWLEGENEEWQAACERERAAKNRRNQAYRQRRKAAGTMTS